MISSLTFYDTVVIGAGIAGLSYAYYFFLQENSKPKNVPTKQLLLLEKNAFVGGRMVSYQVDSKNFIELGPARFHETHVKLLELCKFCNISYSEIKSKKVLTFKSSFTPTLLQPSLDVKKKQIDEPYKLNKEEIKLLTDYQYDTEKLLLDLTNVHKQIIPENISLYDYIRGKMGTNLTQVLQHTDGFSLNWGMAAKEASLSLEEMYGGQKWFVLNESMETFAQILLTKLISNEKKMIDCQLSCNVSKIHFEENQQLFRIGKKNPLSGTCNVLCKNLVLALDTYGLKELIEKNNLSSLIPEFHRNKIDLVRDLQYLQPYNLLRMYAVFEKDLQTNKYWFDSINLPVIYSASKLQMIIPTSIPGVLQFSYSDGKNANSWVDLIKKIPSDQMQTIKEGRTWIGGYPPRPPLEEQNLRSKDRFTGFSRSAPQVGEDLDTFCAIIVKELSLLFPNVSISKPTLIIAHLCHVMQLLPSPSPFPSSSSSSSSSSSPGRLETYQLPNKIFRPTKTKNFAIIGEATCLSSDLGITSSWLESAIRSSFKGFNHINQKENNKIQTL